MSQTLLTIFEDRTKKLSLTPAQMDDILSFSNLLGKNKISISLDGYLHVRHYVGFISKGKTRLQILPKIYEDIGLHEENEQRESMRVMLNLLRVSGFNKVLALSEQSSFAEQNDLLEVFISIFASKVFYTYSRQMNREYITISENSPYVKGHIDFSTNLLENPFRKDLHIINYQSFEHDNLINNIIKTICVRLIRLTNDGGNKKDLRKALILLDDAREIHLSKDRFDLVKFTRLNMPFKPVFEMARMFFYNLAPLSYQGDDTVCSFLIPLNELFEYYLYKLFDAFEDSTTASYQNTRLFARSNDFRLSLRPDIVLRQGEQPILIADAKYKNPKYQNGIYTNISQADIYQVYTYAKIYGINSVALIYPQFENHNTPPMTIELGEGDEKISLLIGCVDIRTADVAKSSMDLKNLIWSQIYRYAK
ncbi:MAG: McrC family protein [Anaerovoracaceae bacterium]|jgi:5-methylcytosine-specific restriction enzyme subunit McrC